MTRALTLCLAALALVAAGCGGSSKDDYESQVRDVGKTLEQTFGDLGTSISGSGSTEQAAQRLEQGATSLDKASRDLAKIDPPSEIQAQHKDLVAGLAELADEFRTGAAAAKGGDLNKLLQFASSLQSSKAVRKITKAGDEIEKKGYDFEPNSG